MIAISFAAKVIKLLEITRTDRGASADDILDGR